MTQANRDATYLHVAFGIGRVGVGFHKNTVGTGNYCSSGDSLYHFGATTGNTTCCIGLLERMSAVYNHRALASFLHARNSSEINNQVTITESSASLGYSNIVASSGAYFLDGKTH